MPMMSAHDLISLAVECVLLVLAITGKRRGLRAAFKISQEIATREADSARKMAVAARKGGLYDVAVNLDAQADALRSLVLQLDYRMASSFLKPDPQEEGAEDK